VDVSAHNVISLFFLLLLPLLLVDSPLQARSVCLIGHRRIATRGGRGGLMALLSYSYCCLVKSLWCGVSLLGNGTTATTTAPTTDLLVIGRKVVRYDQYRQ